MIRIRSSILILISMLMISCESTAVRTVPQNEPVDPLQIKLDEAFSKVYLSCEAVRVTPISSGLLQAQVDIANNRLSHQSFAYKFNWYDDSGYLIPTQLSVWKPLTLPSKETKTLISQAPTREASSFLVKVRRSK